MVKSSPGKGWSSGGALFLWAATILIVLSTVMVIAQGAQAGALPLGRSGTLVVLIVLSVVAVAVAALAWRGVSGPVRAIAAGAQFLGAVLILVVLFGFSRGDSTNASSVTPLLLYCAFAEAMIGAGVLHSARRPVNSTRGH